MKQKNFTHLAAISAFALAITFSACQNNTSKTGSTTPKKDSSTATVDPSQKIVFVNSDSLLSKYDYYKDLKTKFDSKTKSAQADMQSKTQAFQREVAEYQKNAATLAADVRKSTEERLGRKQQELQTYQQNAGGSLQNDQAAENEKLYNKIADYLKGYAKDKGYKMVMTYAKGSSAILYADDSLDVTSEVIKGLNEDYAKTKK
ncbi:outer membrane protein [Pedobacter sp. UYP30]|uniref:OmpH family outer membrane protein n=1 Tax=Pedobacter sp. UYP30 TaxID=1756400 RepID=UPI0033933C65